MAPRKTKERPQSEDQRAPVGLTHKRGDIQPQTRWRIIDQSENSLDVIVNVNGKLAVVQRLRDGSGPFGQQVVELPASVLTAVIRGLRGAARSLAMMEGF